MEPIISVKNIGKRYTITHKKGGYLALRDIIAYPFKHPIQFAKRKLTSAIKTEDFWALSDITFDIERGDVFGIIGHNGAGKSTLLKILSRITPPSSGEAILRGSVGSLLEVGTGFHPELTGRENIYLNGAILGMGRKEIQKKFDEIVEFSGIEKFLDTPVKYYSSGMHVRLAFSVAAHLDPDILLIDEVLAVGDADFQKKCLGKMEEVTKKEGRTILFVSHNMGAIQTLCNKCLLLEKGKMVKIGPPNQIVSEYLSLNKKSLESKTTIMEAQHVKGNKKALITSVELSGEKEEKNTFCINETITMRIGFEINDTQGPWSFWVLFMHQDGNIVLNTFQKDIEQPRNIPVGKHEIIVKLTEPGLMPGRYIVIAGIFMHHAGSHEFADWVEPAQVFDVADAFINGKPFDNRWGAINKNAIWNLIK